jgi:VCBS repeat-containing protein
LPGAWRYAQGVKERPHPYYPYNQRTIIRRSWQSDPAWAKPIRIGSVAVAGFALTGAALVQPALLTFSPRAVEFGGVVRGGTETAEIQLQNDEGNGPGGVVIKSMSINGPDRGLFSVDDLSGEAIDAGGALTVVVGFSPDAVGLKQASLTIEHTGRNSPLVVELSGRGAEVFRVAAGETTIPGSPAWGRDEPFLETPGRVEAASSVTPSDVSLPDGTPGPIFDNRRIASGNSLGYEFLVKPGRFEVRLYFGLGSPVPAAGVPMEIRIEGQPVMAGFDPARNAHASAVMVPFDVNSDGRLTVELRSSKPGAWVSAIEVVDISQSEGAQLEAVPGRLDFGPALVTDSREMAVALRNAGDPLIDPAVVLTNLTVPAGSPFAVANPGPRVIGHGRSLDVSAMFSPALVGEANSDATIAHNGTTSMLAMSGTGWMAMDDLATTVEDTGVAISPLTNDGDPDGTILELFSVADPIHGSLTTTGTTMVYTPNPDFNGPDEFTYQVRDRTGAAAQARVRIIVEDVNDPPVAEAGGPYRGTTQQGVKLSGLRSADPDGSLDTYRWTFGDGSTSSIASPTHLYRSPGSYTAALTVTDDDGITHTDRAVVTIDTTLQVSATGDGSGSVSSSLGTLNCGSDCTSTHVIGQKVSLTATAGTDSEFVGWSGACSGTGTCLVTMSDDKEVEAEFRHLYTLTVVAQGDGSIRSIPLGISCPSSCSLQFVSGSTVILVATPGPGSSFSGWDGALCFTENCPVPITAARTITARFNDPPIAANDSGSTAEDSGVTVSVLSNDSDPNGDALTLSGHGSPGQAGAGLSCTTTGSCTYTPPADFSGTDSFAYVVSDGQFTDTATVSITVTAANDPPTASSRTVSGSEDTPAGWSPLVGDIDGDQLTCSLVTGPAVGSAAVSPTCGSSSYTPPANFNGVVTFTYRAFDGTAFSAAASVRITVSGVNDPPVATPVTDSGPEDSTIGWAPQVSDVDGDQLVCAIVGQPSQGTAAVTSNCSSGTYTPPPNFSSPPNMVFSYRVCDRPVGGACSIASVSITVTEINDPPVANPDSYATSEDGQLNVGFFSGVLDNDTDPEGDSLIARNPSNPPHGSLVLNSSGSFTYTPDPNYSGTDSFTYQAFDGSAFDTTTVTITITSVNDGPTASFTHGSVGDAPTTVSFNASASSDPDGSIVSYTWNWDDGSSGSGETTSHTFDDPGTYVVVLTVRDDDGAVDTASQVIVVDAPPTTTTQPPTTTTTEPPTTIPPITIPPITIP